jgi:hypothetical protein
VGRLQDLIEARLGVSTEARSTAVGRTIGTSVEAILRNEPDRLAAIIVNLSTNGVWIAPDRAVSTTRGIRLSAAGGSHAMIWDEDFDLLGWEWFAVSDGAASEIFVLEVLGR